MPNDGVRLLAAERFGEKPLGEGERRRIGKEEDGTVKDVRQEWRRLRLFFEDRPSGRCGRLNGDEPAVIPGEYVQMGSGQIKAYNEGFEVALVGVEECDGGGFAGGEVVILRHPGSEAPCEQREA